MTSTKLRLGAWVTLLAVWTVGSTVYGGAGRHDRPKERYLEFAKQFPAVGSVYGLGTGTLVAPQWVLTCAHGIEIIDRIVPDKSRHTVRLAGKEYKIASVVPHPDRKPLTMAMMAGGEAENQNEHDLLLLRLADPVTDVEPLGLFAGEFKPGVKAVFAGCGTWISDGQVGVSLAEANAGKRGELHVGTNRIDRIEGSGLLVMSFTAPNHGATDLEIGFSAGDSGGPMLIQDRGKWKVAGLASQAGEIDISSAVGRYGDEIMGTQVSRYVDWIRSTIRDHSAGE